MAKNETAKQRRERKTRERKQRELYERGQIPPAIGKGKRGREKAMARMQTEQRKLHEIVNRSASDANTLPTEQFRDEVYALHELAYEKYSRLIEQGTPNAATVMYESEFALMPIHGMSLNELRAFAAKLRHWLKRKDLYAKRQKHYQQSQIQRLKSYGIDANADSLKDYYDFVSKARQLGANPNWKNTRGSPPVSVKIAYARYQSGEVSLADALHDAIEGMKREYEQSITATSFGFNPLESGISVQRPESSRLLAHFKTASRMPKFGQQPTNRAQRRAAKKKKRR